MGPITIALLVAIAVVMWRVRGRLSLGEHALMMFVGLLFASTTMGVTVHHAATR